MLKTKLFEPSPFFGFTQNDLARQWLSYNVLTNVAVNPAGTRATFSLPGSIWQVAFIGTSLTVAGFELTGGTITDVELLSTSSGNVIAAVSGLNVLATDFQDMIDAANTERINLGETFVWAAAYLENLIFGSQDQRVVGSTGLDYLHGGDGDDTILGRGGDDVIFVTDGTDFIHGGGGKNTLVITEVDEMGDITVNLNTGTLDFELGPSQTVVNFSEVRTGKGDDLIIGNSLANVLTGNAGDDEIRGLGGDDILDGGGGKDFLVGGSGNDLAFGGGGADVIFGDGGNDELFGGDGKDFITGDNGDDLISGGSGEDDLRGNNGDDRISGGDSQDLIIGGPGNDRIWGDAGNDGRTNPNGGDGLPGLLGGSGNDRMFGGNGFDIMSGGADDDVMFGNGGWDWLLAGSGNDRVNGGAGKDEIDGGTGDDILSGGTDADIFTFDNSFAEGDDIIVDFEAGDVIHLRGETAANVSTSGSLETTVTYDSGTIVLNGIDSQLLTVQDHLGVVEIFLT